MLRSIEMGMRAAALSTLALAVSCAACSGAAKEADQARDKAPATRATLVPDALFSASSFWRTSSPTEAPLNRNSPAMVDSLVAQVRTGGFSPWINTGSFSVPVYRVDRDVPTVRVKLDVNVPGLQEAWERVPLPSGATAANGTDKHLVVLQTSTDTMWEFFKFRKEADGYHARWGGRVDRFSTSPGHYTGEAAGASWGATATGLPLLGGLITPAELQRGAIEHALAMALPVMSDTFVAPALRTDTTAVNAGPIPAGTRFRLDPSFDVATLKGPAIVRTLARAAQKYGIVVRDGAGAVTLYAEDPRTMSTSPYSGPTGLFGGWYPDRIMRQLPWERFQALQPPATFASSRVKRR